MTDIERAINICKKTFKNNFIGNDKYKNFVILMGQKDTLNIFKKELDKLNIKPDKPEYLQIQESNYFKPGEIYIEEDKNIKIKYLLNKNLIKINYEFESNYRTINYSSITSSYQQIYDSYDSDSRNINNIVRFKWI